MTLRAGLLIAAAVACHAPAFAAPDLRDGRRAGPLTVYPDDARRNLFYFAPGDLAIATRDGGQPDLHLLHARYTGTAATGDRGTAVVRSIFTVRIVMNGPTLRDVNAARAALSAATSGSIELRPLPIRRVESAIVYAPVEGHTERALPSGHFEAAENAALPRDGYWTERIYTLGLGPADAQLLSEALERGRLAMSVGYAFLAEGIGAETALQEISGSPELVAALQAQVVKGTQTPAGGEAPVKAHVVRAGAVGITVDALRWPGIVRRLDINESAPPGYAALDVYCYDFSQGARGTRYETRVEVQAAGVGGRPVTLTAIFNRAQPDLYARSLRFPVAVRMDRPYRYRVSAIDEEGSERTSAWRERKSWSELLDVTTSNGEFQ